MTLKKNIRSRIHQSLVAGLTLVSGAMYQSGCVDSGLGDYYYPSSYDVWDGGWYGPIDDDVFQNAADAWSDYIRM